MKKKPSVFRFPKPMAAPQPDERHRHNGDCWKESVGDRRGIIAENLKIERLEKVAAGDADYGPDFRFALGLFGHLTGLDLRLALYSITNQRS
jgi:hypothetical protein